MDNILIMICNLTGILDNKQIRIWETFKPQPRFALPSSLVLAYLNYFYIQALQLKRKILRFS